MTVPPCDACYLRGRWCGCLTGRDPLRSWTTPRTLLDAIEVGDVPPSRWYSDVTPNPKYL